MPTRDGDATGEIARAHFADAAVAHVGDDNVAICIDRHAPWVIEARVASVPIHKATMLRASERGDSAVWCHLADAAVARVGDDDIALCIDRHAAWVIEARVASVPIGKACILRASERGDGAVWCHLADAVVARVGNDGVALCINRHAAWALKARVASVPIGKAFILRASERGDGAVWCHLADAVVARVGDDDIALCINRHAAWLIKARVASVPIGKATGFQASERAHRGHALRPRSFASWHVSMHKRWCEC